MRRSDREVRDIPDILSILDRCEVMYLGLSEDDMPYVLPLNFGYEYTGGKLCLYFHGAGEGKKHDMIKKNPNASFAASCSHKFVMSQGGANATMEYESVMGSGKIEVLTGDREKRRGLDLIMLKYSGKGDCDFPDRVIAITSVFRLTVDSFTGKRNM